MLIRLVRLYPLYLLALAISALLGVRQLTKGELDPWTFTVNLATAVLFLPSPAATALFPLNVPAWSLFFELIANSVFGGLRRRLSDAGLATIVAVSAAALFVCAALSIAGFGQAELGRMADGFEWSSFPAGVLRVAYSFFAGVLVYRVWLARPPRVRIPLLVVAVALAAILCADPPGQFQAAFDMLAVGVAFPSLVYLGANARATGNIGRLCSWLGTASYATYVLQAPIYDFAFRAMISLKVPMEHLSSIWAIGFVALVTGSALVADRYFDRPLRAAIMSRVNRRSFRVMGTAIRPEATD
jgi:peptidoglycan/LPS O-acetylase OafA/YrhL